MNEQQVIALINAQIKANDNKEITGNILNLVLKEMVAQPNLLIGDLSSLSTGINDDLVSAINWLLTQISGGNIVIHTGQNNPNETPPATYTVGDLYSQLDVMNNPLYLWQYTGTEWARISNYIDDSIEALDTTWSSNKISEAIKGDRLNGVPTIVLDENEITISGLTWYIQGNAYILIPAFTDTIPYTSELGYSRKDIVVAIQSNSLVRIQGDEGTGIVQPPQVPPNTLLVTEFDVYHDSVGETTDPITGDQYIKKSSEAFVQIVPTTAEIKLNIDNNRNFVVNSSLEQATIVGVVKTTTNGSTTTDTNWSGSDLYIYRKIGSGALKIKHHSIPDWTSLGYTLYFPDGQDYDVEEGELLTFKIMQPGTLITNSPIIAFPIYIFAGSSKVGSGGGSTSDDISNESTVTGANVTEALDELQDNKEDKGKATFIKVNSTSAGTAQSKVGTTANGDYTPTAGDLLEITFSIFNSHVNPAIDIDGSGLKPLKRGGYNNIRPSPVYFNKCFVLVTDDLDYELLSTGGIVSQANSIVGNPSATIWNLAQNITLGNNTLLGRGAGNLGQIELGTNLSFDGNTLNATGGGITALTGDVTASGTGSVSATIPNGTVTNAKMANMSGFSVKGKPTTGSGAPSDITLGTNTILGRGSGNIVPLTLDSSLQISGSTLRVNPANDRYTKTYFVDLTITMGQFLALHTTPVSFPSLGLAGGEYAFIESAAGIVDLNFTGGTLNANPSDNVRLAIYREPTRIVGGSTYGEQNLGAKKFVNQFHVGNFTNEPATSFQLGTEAPVTYSGTPTGTVKVRVYYKISNF